MIPHRCLGSMSGSTVELAAFSVTRVKLNVMQAL
jgi:hypothetical protein